MIKENIVKLKDEDLAKINGGIIKKWEAIFLGVPTDDADARKNLVDGRAKKLGELEVVTATAIIAIPVTIGITKLAAWGFDRLTKLWDKKLDAKKIK